MQNIFEALALAERVSQTAKDLEGKVYGLNLAVVADIQDPLRLDRVKVMLPSKGGKTLSDWLSRMTLSPFLGVPLVQLGDTVVVAFFDGDPHNGVYLGVLNNLVNPPQPVPDSFVINPQADLQLSAKVIKLTVGDASLTLDDQGKLAIAGVSSMSVNGKQVATLDAKDDRGHSLVSKGWS